MTECITASRLSRF